jgi:hypothetical protein
VVVVELGLDPGPGPRRNLEPIIKTLALLCRKRANQQRTRKKVKKTTADSQRRSSRGRDVCCNLQ